MHRALKLAAAHVGATAENPSVGCVIVQGKTVVGEGVTGLGGRPHAETIALAAAGENARGADVYVTLEPCAHHGRTPPCVDALIAANVSRVFIACVDPDSRTAGLSITKLRAAGIAVEVGLCEAEAKQQHRGFFRRLSHGLPHVTMKIATSADGFMGNITAPYITSESARAHGQALRANVGALITGVQTVIDDDPQLTCRIPGLENRNPARIILDRTLRTPLNSYVVKTAEKISTYIFTKPGAMQTSAALDLRERGVNLVAIEDLGGEDSMSERAYSAVSTRQHADVETKQKTPSPQPSPPSGEGVTLLTILREAAKLPLTHVLIEAGPTLSQAFLQANLVDVLYWYQSPHALGDQGSHYFGSQWSADIGHSREGGNPEQENGSPMKLRKASTPAYSANSGMTKTFTRIITSSFLAEDTLNVYQLTPCLPD